MNTTNPLPRFSARYKITIIIALSLVIGCLAIFFSVRYIRAHNTVYNCEDASSAIASGSGLDRFRVVDPFGKELSPSQIEGLQKYVINPYLNGLKVKKTVRQPDVRNGFFSIEQLYCRGDRPVHYITVDCDDAPGRPVVELYGILESLWTPPTSGSNHPSLNAFYMNAYNGIERDKAALIKSGIKSYGVYKGVTVSWDAAAAGILKKAQMQSQSLSSSHR